MNTITPSKRATWLEADALKIDAYLEFTTARDFLWLKTPASLKRYENAKIALKVAQDNYQKAFDEYMK